MDGSYPSYCQLSFSSSHSTMIASSPADSWKTSRWSVTYIMYHFPVCFLTGHFNGYQRTDRDTIILTFIGVTLESIRWDKLKMYDTAILARISGGMKNMILKVLKRRRKYPHLPPSWNMMNAEVRVGIHGWRRVRLPFNLHMVFRMAIKYCLSLISLFRFSINGWQMGRFAWYGTHIKTLRFRNLGRLFSIQIYQQQQLLHIYHDAQTSYFWFWLRIHSDHSHRKYGHRSRRGKYGKYQINGTLPHLLLSSKIIIPW